MKIILICLFFLYFLQSGFAQSRKLDSLSQLIIQSKSDTARIRLMNAKSRAFARINLDSALSIGNAALQLARKIGHLKGEADAYISVGTSYISKSSFAEAKENLDKAEKLYRKISDSAGIYELADHYGMFYGMQSKYDSSIIFFEQAVAYDERNKNMSELATSLQNLAVSHMMKGDYKTSVTYQSRALKLAEERDDWADIAYINANMAINYSNLEDHTRCEEFNLRAISYAKKAGLKNVELYAYANLASNSNSLSRFSDGYNYGMRAVKLGKELGDYAIVATSLSRAGWSLSAQGKFGEAERLEEQAINLVDSVGAALNIFQVYNTMGEVKYAQGKYEAAISYFEKAIAAVKGADIYDTQIAVGYKDLSDSYEKTGRFDKALAAYRQSREILDSIKTRDNVKKVTEVQMNYEFDKKQQAAKAEQDKKNVVTSAKQLRLVAGLVCLLLVSILAFFAYRNKRKANLLLHDQKQKLEQTLTELKTTQAQLIQSEKMASLGELTAGIAHEIQNPLNFVNNFSEVNKELINELFDEVEKGNIGEVKMIATDIKGNSEKINQHGKRADAIVKGMLQHSRLTSGAKELTDINALCDEHLRLSYHGVRARDSSFNATIKTDFDSSIGNMKVIPQDLGRVLLNLYNNAFYAVNEKRQSVGEAYQPGVSVKTKKELDKIIISVTDNGNGVTQHIIDKIFQPFFTTKPTGQGTGLGLSLAYDIMKAHAGK